MSAKTIILAAAAAALVSVPAQAASNCIFVRNIDNFKPAKDEKSLIISDSPSRKYNVTLFGRCTGLRFTETIAVRAVGGQFCLTPGDSIWFFDTGIRRQCMIDKIEPVPATPAATPAAAPDDGGVAGGG